MLINNHVFVGHSTEQDKDRMAERKIQELFWGSGAKKYRGGIDDFLLDSAAIVR